jgi:hypothetical protein
MEYIHSLRTRFGKETLGHKKKLLEAFFEMYLATLATRSFFSHL